MLKISYQLPLQMLIIKEKIPAGKDQLIRFYPLYHIGIVQDIYTFDGRVQFFTAGKAAEIFEGTILNQPSERS